LFLGLLFCEVGGVGVGCCLCGCCFVFCTQLMLWAKFYKNLRFDSPTSYFIIIIIIIICT
jgi:hypothetical protein